MRSTVKLLLSAGPCPWSPPRHRWFCTCCSTIFSYPFIRPLGRSLGSDLGPSRALPSIPLLTAPCTPCHSKIVPCFPPLRLPFLPNTHSACAPGTAPCSTPAFRPPVAPSLPGGQAAGAGAHDSCLPRKRGPLTPCHHRAIFSPLPCKLPSSALTSLHILFPFKLNLCSLPPCGGLCLLL